MCIHTSLQVTALTVRPLFRLGWWQENKGKRIEEKRGEQKEFMKSVVQRVLGEFIDAGRLGKAELDDAAKTVLEKLEAKVGGVGDTLFLVHGIAYHTKYFVVTIC